MEYKNFFETQKEAEMRLTGTVVLYDGQPVEILAITDHESDGIMRAYIRDIGYTPSEVLEMPHPPLGDYPPGHSMVGKTMDDWLDKNPSSGIVRKQMNSPKFNRFIPFELGMYWKGTDVYYVERQPNRSTLQGLAATMLVVKKPSLTDKDGENFRATNIYLNGPEMRRCILGEHPSPSRCLQALQDSKYANEAAAFHRHFCLLKGPVDTLYLVYKYHVIGVLPNNDFTRVKLGREYRHYTEVVSDLGLFSSITY